MYYTPANENEKFDTCNVLSKQPDEALTLEQLCEELSISTATGRNWLKLGKLTPSYTENKSNYFFREYVNGLRKRLVTGENRALKSRRNKNFVSGNSLYNSYVSRSCQNLSALQNLLSLISDNDIKLNTSIIQLMTAECALQLFALKPGINVSEKSGLLSLFLTDSFSIGEYDELIRALISDTASAIIFCKEHPEIFNIEYVYEPNEDILGLIYISCRNIGSRKANGSYYTSNSIVKQLINRLDFNHESKLLDPCCGTGNFLMQLPKNVAFDSIYGNDIDSTGVKITRLNMALKYGASLESIYAHITNADYLTGYTLTGFTHIIGNPPWGYEFSAAEKNILKSSFKTASGKSIEAYDIFIEQSLRLLSDNGRLAFVLPEAILNVKAHTGVREIILQCCSIKSLDYIGNAFDGVHCPCVIMDLKYTNSSLSTLGMTVNTGTDTFTVNTERRISSGYFNFAMTDDEYNVLEKIKSTKNAAYLLNNADFALGIVTGNNSEYITSAKNAENEIILRGADIDKYHINPPANYITFTPEHFQQTAPVEMYRAPEKLLYRFISKQLTFAYDDKQLLSLNSCNIVIPKIPGIKMKYVLAILNSRIAQFIYKREFNSIKVLRSHIESIPIPPADETVQNRIIKATDRLISGLEPVDAETAYDELDSMIAELFGLDLTEIEIIKKSADG